jgi:P-type Cu2+ transporter
VVPRPIPGLDDRRRPVAALVERLGYEAHELDARALAPPPPTSGRDLLMRVGVSGFAMMNVMLLSVSVWSGAEAATRDMFHWVSAPSLFPRSRFRPSPSFAAHGRR